MVTIKSQKEQLQEAAREINELREKNLKQEAKIDYLSMMTDVEFDEEESENVEEI